MGKVKKLFITLSALVFLSLSIQAASPYTHSEMGTVETGDEAKIRNLREQELTQLRITLGRRQPTNRRADLYIRVAELYLEAYRATFLLEGKVHEKRLQSGSSESYIDRSHSKPYLSKGIQACLDILKLKIPYSKLDEVYYFLGLNYHELEMKKESAKYFQYFARQFPNSPFISDVYRQLGDNAFVNNEYLKSVNYYELASQRRSELGDHYPRILHKLAWSYYKTKQYDRAVETMKQAIERSQSGGDKFLSLREEALRDMALFMTETGRAEEAIIYFEKVAGDKSYYVGALEKLGKQYERNVEPEKAIRVYEALQKTAPDEEANFRVLVKLVDLNLRKGKYKEAVGRIRNGKLLIKGEAETLTAAQNLKAMVRRTATEHHDLFRKKENRAALGVAEEFYQLYLDIFLEKDDPRKETPEIEMYLAEVERELGKSQQATDLYKKVLDSGDKRYAKEAAVLKISSLSDAIKKAPKNKGTEPSSLEKEFIAMGDELKGSLGDLSEGRETALKSAQILAGYPDTQKNSIKRIHAIIETWPKSSQAVVAARLWIQILSDQIVKLSPSDLEKSEEAKELKIAIDEIRIHSELLSTDQKSGGGKLRTQMAEIETRFRVGKIAYLEKEKDYGSAGKNYETFATEATKSDVAEKAYKNALSSYIKIADLESILRVGSNWIRRFPKSTLAQSSIKSGATSLFIQGKFSESAGLFEKIGLTGADQDSLETAAKIYHGVRGVAEVAGVQETHKAQECRMEFLRLYKSSPHYSAVLFSLARSQAEEKQESEASKNYRHCLNLDSDRSAECGVRLAELYEKSSQFAQAKALYKKIATHKNTTLKNSNGNSANFIAYSRYHLAELLEKEARFSALQLPEKQLQKAMKQRLSFLEPLSKAYREVVATGGPWGVAALNRLALWAFAFADEVDKISPPSNTNAEALVKFKKSLESISQPLRKKAYQTWSDAYQNALQHEILSPVIAEITDHLLDLGQGQLTHAQGFRGRFKLAGIPADGGKEGHESSMSSVREKLLKNPEDAASWVDYGNLLWGEQKLLLAKTSYEYALGLKKNSLLAFNNMGVVIASGAAEEDWFSVAEADWYFRQALKQDGFFTAAEMNQAAIFNYYRLFSKAKPLWEQSIAKVSSSDGFLGLAISLQGGGVLGASEAAFKKAEDLGEKSENFSQAYHLAARKLTQKKSDECLSTLKQIDEKSLAGFEKTSVENLTRICQTWKK